MPGRNWVYYVPADDGGRGRVYDDKPDDERRGAYIRYQAARLCNSLRAEVIRLRREAARLRSALGMKPEAVRMTPSCGPKLDGPKKARPKERPKKAGGLPPLPDNFEFRRGDRVQIHANGDHSFPVGFDKAYGTLLRRRDVRWAVRIDGDYRNRAILLHRHICAVTHGRKWYSVEPV